MSAVLESQLPAQIAELNELDRAACLERWRESLGRQPPKHLSPQFMRRVLIWELQTRLLGGPSKKTECNLQRIAGGKEPRMAAKTRSQLVREWNGRTYQVAVTAEGYVMDGHTYRSLSAVAQRITGAHWSGPRFFGTG